MNVENLRRKLLHEPGREQAHVTGETDQVDLIVEKCSHNFAVVRLAWFTFRWNDQRVEAAMADGFEAGSIGTIRNHDRNPGIGYPARRNAVGNRHKIGAPSG